MLLKAKETHRKNSTHHLTLAEMLKRNGISDESSKTRESLAAPLDCGDENENSPVTSYYRVYALIMAFAASGIIFIVCTGQM